MSLPSSYLTQLIKVLPKESYFVGGAIRDRLLNRACLFFVLVLNKNPLPYAEKLARVFKGSAFPLDTERGIYRVTLDSGLYFDLSQRQGNSFEADIDRRDFSINALALSIQDWAKPNWKKLVIDRHNGLKALVQKKMVPVSKTIFKDDPLRLLRAFRFAAELNFEIDTFAVDLISKNKNRIRTSAPERIREEFLKIFSTPWAHNMLCHMDKTGILDVLFPEAKTLRTTAPDYYGKGGVLKHTLDSVKFFEEIVFKLKSWFPKTHVKIRTYLDETLQGYSRFAHCKWGLLLHDIGKPATARMIDGRLRFFEHEHVGADKVPKIAPRFRWSTDETQRYSRWVRNHMRPGNLAVQENLTDKAIHRFFRDLGDDAVAMLLVSLADHLTYLTPRQLKARNSAHEKTTLKMIHRYYTQKEKILPPKLLNGYDIMKIFKLSPSPLIGTLLKDLEEAQCGGHITTKDAALNHVKRRLHAISQNQNPSE